MPETPTIWDPKRPEPDWAIKSITYNGETFTVKFTVAEADPNRVLLEIEQGDIYKQWANNNLTSLKYASRDLIRAFIQERQRPTVQELLSDWDGDLSSLEPELPF